MLLKLFFLIQTFQIHLNPLSPHLFHLQNVFRVKSSYPGEYPVEEYEDLHVHGVFLILSHLPDYLFFRFFDFEPVFGVFQKYGLFEGVEVL